MCVCGYVTFVEMEDWHLVAVLRNSLTRQLCSTFKFFLFLSLWQLKYLIVIRHLRSWRQLWLLYVPPGSAFINLHDDVIWIPEQTAIISLYNINCLVFITKTQCVYCAVRTECVYGAVRTECVYCAVRTECVYCAVRTECVYCAVRTECVYCAVRTECVYCAVRL